MGSFRQSAKSSKKQLEEFFFYSKMINFKTNSPPCGRLLKENKEICSEGAKLPQLRHERDKVEIPCCPKTKGKDEVTQCGGKEWIGKVFQVFPCFHSPTHGNKIMQFVRKENFSICRRKKKNYVTIDDSLRFTTTWSCLELLKQSIGCCVISPMQKSLFNFLYDGWRCCGWRDEGLRWC